jgi:methionyl aminopeptidase
VLKRIETMNSAALERMRESCSLAAECLVMVGERIRAGITTDEINTWVHQYCLEHDALPAPLNYKGFPKSVCTSVNECVCHGIPDGTVLKDGDIVNVDVTTIFPTTHGYFGDTSVTFYIGQPSEEAKLVTEVARRGLELGIAQVRHGAAIGDIGAAIHEYADKMKCSVVRDYVGHGVGREFHMPPQVPHYRARDAASRLKMKAGMVFTIEPMINIGTYETELMKDRWTVLTADRKLSAQFEHTILVTRNGAEVLTARSQLVKHSEDLPWSDLGPLSTPAAFPAAV